MDSFGFIFTFIKALVVCFALRYLLERIRYYRKAPPGPWGFPFIGVLNTLASGNALLKCQEYKKKYGDIFSIKVGHFDAVVINNYKLIIEALKKEEFQGRPDFESWVVRNDGDKNRGVLFSDGVKSWQEQRRFALKQLRDFGFGKESMEGMLLYEVAELVKRFKKNLDEPITLKSYVNCSVFNSLWYIVSGERFELDDPKFLEIMRLFAGFLDRLPIFSPSQLFPWPVKYNLIKPGLWQHGLNFTNKVKGYIAPLVEEHIRTYNSDVTRDFIDVYLHRHHKTSSAGSSFGPDEGLKHLKVILLDLFAAGTETTSTTLHWALLFLCKYPDVQVKLQQELDRVVGKNPVSREDRPRLPYLEAFINEVHRKASIVPMSVYHKVFVDCEFRGFLFQKDTIIYPNLYDAHHDKEFWGDAEIFRPDRFLDSTGTKVESKEALMPFSTGKRTCLGETLARDTLYYFLSGLIQSLSFQLDPASGDVDIDTPKPNFVKSPYEFRVILQER